MTVYLAYIDNGKPACVGVYKTFKLASKALEFYKERGFETWVACETVRE